MITITLNTLERIRLAEILPTQGNIVTLKSIKRMQELLSFSEEEIKTLKLKYSAKEITWDTELGKLETAFSFSKFELEIIKNQIEILNDKKALGLDFLSVYDKLFAESIKE